jgi:hypothetical protein
VTQNKIFQEINPGIFCIYQIILVNHTGENWNCIFGDLVHLCERLEELNAESILGPL